MRGRGGIKITLQYFNSILSILYLIFEGWKQRWPTKHWNISTRSLSGTVRIRRISLRCWGRFVH